MFSLPWSQRQHFMMDVLVNPSYTTKKKKGLKTESKEILEKRKEDEDPCSPKVSGWRVWNRESCLFLHNLYFRHLILLLAKTTTSLSFHWYPYPLSALLVHISETSCHDSCPSSSKLMEWLKCLPNLWLLRHHEEQRTSSEQNQIQETLWKNCWNVLLRWSQWWWWWWRGE